MKHRTTIIGTGNMGTALAIHAATHSPTILYSIEPEVVRDINTNHTNSKYLDGVILPDTITATESIKEALSEAELVIIAVPSSAIESVTKEIAPLLHSDAYVLNTTKGVEADSLSPMIDVVARHIPQKNTERLATLSGPSIANEFARKTPTVVNIASKNIDVARHISSLLETETFRIRPTTDVIGTALGGTLKNIYALALGMCDGVKLGANTKAAIMTLAVEEINIIMKALGATSDDAVHGFAGLGDLFVTGTSVHSRNRSFGEEICVDKNCRIKMQDPTQTIEGVKAVRAIAPFAAQKKLNTPVLFMVERVLADDIDPKQEIIKLFSNI